MEKNLLKDYTDACELIKETERDLQKLRSRRRMPGQNVARGIVKGAVCRNPEFCTESLPGDIVLCGQSCREEELLEERKARAEGIKADVDAWMNAVPARLQRIIRYKFFEGLSWEETAVRIGRQATGESVKKEFQRFMKEN